MLRPKFKTLQASLFLYFSLFFTFVMLATFVLLYMYLFDTTYKKASEQEEQMCISISNTMDTEEEKMDTISENISYSNLIKNHFKQYLSLSSSDPSNDMTIYSKRYANINSLLDVIMAIIGPSTPVSQASIYDMKGNMLGNGLFSGEVKTNISSKSWYKKTVTLDGEKCLSGPYVINLLNASNILNYNHKYITLTRIYENEIGENQGFIEVDQDCETFFKYVNDIRSSSPDTDIFVTDSDGKSIYPYSSNLDAKGKYYNNKIKQNKLEQSQMHVVHGFKTMENQVLSYTKSDTTGWTIILVEPQKVVFDSVNNLSRFFLLLFVLVIGILLVISYFVSKIVTKPLKTLQDDLKGIEITDLSSYTRGTKLNSGTYIEEIYKLHHAFNTMSRNLSVSLNELLTSKSEEMNAKILAIQSQMNPHFLYNNIAIISVMAEEGMNRQVVSFCSDISFMLRYISTDSPDGVELRSEIDYTKKYLDCMKIRYEDAIDYEIDIKPELLNCTVPKLIIQPLVENAIKHGLKDLPPWHIAVTGVVDGDKWSVTVRDNGIGFDPEKLQEFNRFFEQNHNFTKMPKLEIGGMGIKNIYLRLRLLYKEYTVFEIKNSDDGGASVTIGGILNTSERE